MNRRRFLSSSGLAGFGLLSQVLAACNGAPTPPPDAEAPMRVPAAEQPVQATPSAAAAQATTAPAVQADTSETLSLTAPEGYAGIALKPYYAYGQWTDGCISANSIAKKYMADKAEIKVLGADCDVSWQNFNAGLTAIQKENKPIDLFFFQGAPHDLAFRGELLALDSLMQASETATPDKWARGPLESCKWRGKTYGLPMHVVPYSNIMINTLLFEKKKIPSSPDAWPTTWEDLRRLSAEFTVWDLMSGHLCGNERFRKDSMHR